MEKSHVFLGTFAEKPLAAIFGRLHSMAGCVIGRDMVAVGDDGARTFLAGTLLIHGFRISQTTDETWDVSICADEYSEYANALRDADGNVILDALGNPIIGYDWLSEESVAFVESLWLMGK